MNQDQIIHDLTDKLASTGYELSEIKLERKELKNRLIAKDREIDRLSKRLEDLESENQELKLSPIEKDKISAVEAAGIPDSHKTRVLNILTGDSVEEFTEQAQGYSAFIHEFRAIR